MTDFRTVVAMICEATDDATARRIITALTRWADSIEGAGPDLADAGTTEAQAARQLFAEALAGFERAGQTEIGPRDFHDWCEANGRSRPWVSKHLKDLARAGRLIEQTSAEGRYRIIPTARTTS